MYDLQQQQGTYIEAAIASTQRNTSKLASDVFEEKE